MTSNTSNDAAPKGGGVESASMVRASVNINQLPELRKSLVSALRNCSLQNSDELYISVKNSRNGIVLSFQNYKDGDSHRQIVEEDTTHSEKSSISPDSTAHSKSNVKRNYLNIIDVFSLPEYKDQSIQCDLETYDNTKDGRFISSMYFHPFHLKLRRHIKCVQCRLEFPRRLV